MFSRLVSNNSTTKLLQSVLRSGESVITRSYYKLPDIPYATQGLKPFLSSQAISHHIQHHQTDIEKANNLINHTPYRDIPIKKAIKQSCGDASDAPFFNVASSHYNHSFFWKSITNRVTDPSVFLLKAIRMDFGSFDEFRAKFSRMASSMVVPGYTWLIFRDKQLSIINTLNSGSPFELEGAYPILCLDTHEHAYYLDHQSNRYNYIANFWNFVDWDFVESRLLNALESDREYKRSIENATLQEYANAIQRFKNDEDKEILREIKNQDLGISEQDEFDQRFVQTKQQEQDILDEIINDEEFDAQLQMERQVSESDEEMEAQVRLYSEKDIL